MTTPDTAGADLPPLADEIIRAIIACDHVIDDKKIVLRFARNVSGHNALNQLHSRIAAALASREKAEAGGAVPEGELSAESRLSLLTKLANNRGYDSIAKALATIPPRSITFCGGGQPVIEYEEPPQSASPSPSAVVAASRAVGEANDLADLGINGSRCGTHGTSGA